MPTASKGTCLTFETCATIDDEILSKVTSIEEDEEDCEEDINRRPYSTANQVRCDAGFGGSANIHLL